MVADVPSGGDGHFSRTSPIPRGADHPVRPGDDREVRQGSGDSYRGRAADFRMDHVARYNSGIPDGSAETVAGRPVGLVLAHLLATPPSARSRGPSVLVMKSAEHWNCDEARRAFPGR